MEKYIPPKEEKIMEVALTPIKNNSYKPIYKNDTSFLFKGAKPGNSPSLLNVVMELIKCCNQLLLIRLAK